jgi:hypothetical protein
MSDERLVPMLSPDGQSGIIPAANVGKALKAGFKVGVLMKTPNGQRGVVPKENALAAVQSGLVPFDPLAVAAIHMPAAPVPKELAPYSELSDTTLPAVGLGAVPMSPQTAARSEDAITHALPGAAKGLASTLTTVATLGQIKPELLKPAPNEIVGYGAERLAEFLAPSGLLTKGGKAVSAAVKGSKFAKNAPLGGKLLGLVGRAAVEGAGFGAVEAAHGGDLRDVATTAALGAAGPVAEAGLGAGVDLVKKGVSRVFPDASAAILRALKPGKNIAAKMPSHLDAALPEIMEVAQSAGRKIDTVSELADAATAAKQNVWTKIEAIQAKAGASGTTIDTARSVDAGIQALDSASKSGPVSDAAYKEIEHWADFLGKKSLQPAEAELAAQRLNAELETYYRQSGIKRAAKAAASPEIAAKEAIVAQLRSDLDAAVNAATGNGVAELKKTYGALKNVQQAAYSRATQMAASDIGKSPVSWKQAVWSAPGLGTAAYGAQQGDPKKVALGLGEAALGAYLTKARNPDALIESAFKMMNEGRKVSRASTALRAIPKAAVPTARAGAAYTGLRLRGRKEQ